MSSSGPLGKVMIRVLTEDTVLLVGWGCREEMGQDVNGAVGYDNAGPQCLQ